MFLLSLIVTSFSLQVWAGSTDIVLLKTPEPSTQFMVAPPVMPTEGAPEDINQVMAMLSARHADGLPTAADWGRRPSAAPALRWIAAHGPLAFQQERALAALRFFVDDESKAFLLEKALDPSLSAIVRNGAVVGLSGHPLTAADCSRLAHQAEETEGVLRASLKRLHLSPDCR